MLILGSLASCDKEDQILEEQCTQSAVAIRFNIELGYISSVSNEMIACDIELPYIEEGVRYYAPDASILVFYPKPGYVRQE